MIFVLTIKITSMEYACPEILEDGSSNPVIVKVDNKWLSGCFSNEKFYSDAQGIIPESQIDYWFEIPDELI